MRVLVCGSRDLHDFGLVMDVLDRCHEKNHITHIISGAASGIDQLAIEWAQMNYIPFTGVPANWHLYGKSAGPRRNSEMLKTCSPDLLVAFPGGRGTGDMVQKAKAAGLPIHIVPHPNFHIN